MSEFSCWNLWHENGHGFAEDNFVIFDCSPASIAAAHCRRTFFARTKKGAKKVRGGCAHPLDSRERRKTSAPLRSADFTAILEISQFHQTQKCAVFTCSLATAG